jgi:hypothetical protein
MSVVGYNIFLHPLRKYPGPFLASVTDLYAGWHSMRLRLPQVTFSDHKKYGKYSPDLRRHFDTNMVQAR